MRKFNKLDLLDLESESDTDSDTEILEQIIDELNRANCPPKEFDTESDAESEFSISIKKPEPFVTDETKECSGPFICSRCPYETSNKHRWHMHLSSMKHRRQIGELEMAKKERYECKQCKYSTSIKGNYEKHKETLKHKKLVPYENKIRVEVRRKLE